MGLELEVKRRKKKPEQLETDKRDRQIKKKDPLCKDAQDRLQLLKSDVAKEEQEANNQQINVSLKELKISAAESLIAETKTEIANQTAALQQNKAYFWQLYLRGGIEFAPG